MHENPGLPGEYGAFGLLLALAFVAMVVGTLAYGFLKLSLKNPDDVP